MKIVHVAVVDLTRPVTQKGFKSVAIVDFTQDLAVKVITDIKSIASLGGLTKAAANFFSNGGQTLIVAGKAVTDKADIIPFLNEINESNPFYGVSAVVPKSQQAEFYKEINTYVSGNKGLAVLEANGSKDEVIAVFSGTNSDRLVVYANKDDAQTGISGAVDGACFPQNEGSITWGNTIVTDVPKSGYTLAEEQELLNEHINYITEDRGNVVTQFGKTTSGSNADITRTKDFLVDRIEASLTRALQVNKKIEYTTTGMAAIKDALDQVGTQGVTQNMLDSFQTKIPEISDIPTTDKALRVLRNVEFVAVLTGAVETLEVTLTVTLA